MIKRFGTMLLTAACAVSVAACDDDEEMIAPVEPQLFEVTIENVSTVYDFPTSGVFNTPLGEAGPGPLFPGGVYEFEDSDRDSDNGLGFFGGVGFPLSSRPGEALEVSLHRLERERNIDGRDDYQYSLFAHWVRDLTAPPAYGDVRPFLLVGVGESAAVSGLKDMLGDSYLADFVGPAGTVSQALAELADWGIDRVQLTELVPGSHSELAPELLT